MDAVCMHIMMYRLHDHVFDLDLVKMVGRTDGALTTIFMDSPSIPAAYIRCTNEEHEKLLDMIVTMDHIGRKGSWE